MRARDLARPFPTVRPGALVIDAARLLAGQDLPGLIVVDDGERPITVLPGTDVLRMAVPRYCQDDPALARVVDEATADVFTQQLGQTTVAQAVGRASRTLPAVERDATALEIAALMARSGSPLVAVVDADGVLLGAITLDALLDRVLAQ